MSIVDLTHPFSNAHVFIEEKALKSARTEYTGLIYHFRYGSMASSYIDLPGHIAETDDGREAANEDIADYYRQPATVLRPEYDPETGAVSAAALERAAAGKTLRDILIVHALGERNDSDIPERSVYLDMDAVDWVIARGCRILVSDVWESTRLDGVFLKFFAAGVSTVCNLVNLQSLPEDEVRLNIIFTPLPGATQIPCRIFAEV